MPPGPDAEAMGSENEIALLLLEAVVACVVEEEVEVEAAGYFLPGMRKKSNGNTVAVPLPLVPAGGFGNAAAGGTDAGFLAAGFRAAGAVTVDAMGRRCPGNAPMALASPMPRSDD